MNQPDHNHRRLRYSLRHLFAVMTGVAVGITAGLLIAAWLVPGPLPSPDQDEFWLEWLAHGTPQQRETAVTVIATRARTPTAGQNLLDALVEAASDSNPLLRSYAAVGLQDAAKTNQEVRAMLQDLADHDPDANVRGIARQALAEGIPRG